MFIAIFWKMDNTEIESYIWRTVRGIYEIPVYIYRIINNKSTHTLV